jgi:hypothetical protein
MKKTPKTAELLRQIDEAFGRALARGPQDRELDAADLDGDAHLAPLPKSRHRPLPEGPGASKKSANSGARRTGRRR